MEKRRLGRTGLEVSILGFGASEIGERDASLRTVERLLGSALDAGPQFGLILPHAMGRAKKLIGQAAGSRRKDYHILTKCGHAVGLEFDDWSPELIHHSIERSLKRLRTDYLDVMQPHSCDEEILRQGDVITALQRAPRCGQGSFTLATVVRCGSAIRRHVRSVRHLAGLPKYRGPGGN